VTLDGGVARSGGVFFFLFIFCTSIFFHSKCIRKPYGMVQQLVNFFLFICLITSLTRFKLLKWSNARN